MMNGNKYFPNNWEAFNAAPAEMFEPITFEEFMHWRVANWELPSSVACVIRVQDAKTLKVKEYAYQRRGAAENKIDQLMKTPGIHLTVCDHGSVHHLELKKKND